MCGINGCIHLKDFFFSKEDFSSATNLLNNRGPDTFGVKETILNRFVLKLGHQRLSILGIDKFGDQPMTSENDLFSIVYNGEIYNHISLRKQLSSKSNIKWKSSCDTETLLNLFEYEDIDSILNKIEGMFSFCLFDRINQKLILARDRSGEKPLYLSTGEGFLGFASDLSPLKEIPGFCSSLDKFATQKYLQHNYIPSPLSVYEKSFKLPPGSYISIDLNKYKPKPYSSFEELIQSEGVYYKIWWSLDEGYKNKLQNLSISDREVIDETESLLEASVNKQLISDVPLGAFLSGGIDSSLVVAMMQKNGRESKTYTVGFDFVDYDESIYAEKIANYLGSNHTTYTCNKQDVLDIIPQLPRAFSEPFADSSQIPTMLVSRLARQDVKVALSGDAGDELFGGYNRYLIANKYWRYLKNISPKIRKGGLTVLNRIPKNILSFLFYFSPFSRNLSGSAEVRIQKILDKLKEINDPESFYKSMTVEWKVQSNIMNFDDDRSFKHHLLFQEGSKLSFEEAMMHADFETYLPDDILCKVDRSSMFSSLETRTPFLDKELIEYAYSLPLKYKIRDGQGKWVLKKILSKYLPDKLFERPKQGFGIPISIWMRSDLKEWINDILANEVCSKHGMFNLEIINKIKEEHFQGSHNHEHKLWSVIQFNQWYLDNF